MGEAVVLLTSNFGPRYLFQRVEIEAIQHETGSVANGEPQN
jgi:hypothetical protein